MTLVVRHQQMPNRILVFSSPAPKVSDATKGTASKTTTCACWAFQQLSTVCVFCYLTCYKGACTNLPRVSSSTFDGEIRPPKLWMSTVSGDMAHMKRTWKILLIRSRVFVCLCVWLEFFVFLKCPILPKHILKKKVHWKVQLVTLEGSYSFSWGSWYHWRFTSPSLQHRWAMKKHLVVSFFLFSGMTSYPVMSGIVYIKVLWKVSVFLLLQVSDVSNLLPGNHLYPIFHDCYDSCWCLLFSFTNFKTLPTKLWTKLWIRCCAMTEAFLSPHL